MSGIYLLIDTDIDMENNTAAVVAKSSGSRVENVIGPRKGGEGHVCGKCKRTPLTRFPRLLEFSYYQTSHQNYY